MQAVWFSTSWNLTTIFLFDQYHVKKRQDFDSFQNFESVKIRIHKSARLWGVTFRYAKCMLFNRNMQFSITGCRRSMVIYLTPLELRSYCASPSFQPKNSSSFETFSSVWIFRSWVFSRVSPAASFCFSASIAPVSYTHLKMEIIKKEVEGDDDGYRVYGTEERFKKMNWFW